MAEKKEDVIKPDKREALIVSLFAVGIVLFLILILIFATGVGFLKVIEFFANMFNVNAIIIIIGIPILIGLAVIFINLMISLKFEHSGCFLYENGLILYTNKMLFFTSKNEIPYDRIVKVTMESKNFISSLFNNKDLVFELSGMNDKELRLSSIKNPDAAVTKIIAKINLSRARIQEQIHEIDKINNILDTSRFIYKN